MSEMDKTWEDICRAGACLMRNKHAMQQITAAKESVLQLRQLTGRMTGDKRQAVIGARLALALSELKDMGYAVRLEVMQ